MTIYDLVIRLRSSQPFIDVGDVYAIDGRPGVFVVGRKDVCDLTRPCRFHIGSSHCCASRLGHTTPHQMVQIPLAADEITPFDTLLTAR